MENENNGLGFMILEDTNIFEATDFDALVKEKMLSTIPSEKVAIEMLDSFDVAITEFIEGMKREKAILEEMIANGEFKKRDSENSDLDEQVSKASQFDHGEREPSAEECILVLENLKGRTKFYPEILSEYSEDYIERLAAHDVAVLDKIISILKNRELESMIHVVKDIKDCLRSDRPADDFITKWEEHNADVPDARTAVRAVYAGELERVEAILKKLL